jgi:hypothetical protein
VSPGTGTVKGDISEEKKEPTELEETNVSTYDIKVVEGHKYVSQSNKEGEAFCSGCRKVGYVQQMYYCKENDTYYHEACFVKEPEKKISRKVSRYGWGWIFILVIYANAFQYGQFYNTLTHTITSLLAFPIILIFYFWLRKIIINKRVNDQGTGTSSFIAGLCTYALLFVIMTALYIVSSQQLKSETAIFITEFQKKAQKMKQEKENLSSRFIQSPQTDADLSHNIKLIDEYNAFLDESTVLFDDAINFMKRMNTSMTNRPEKKRNLEERINQLKKEAENAKIKSKEAMNSLKNHYLTGKEEYYTVYMSIMTEQENFQKEVASKTEKIFEDLGVR